MKLELSVPESVVTAVCEVKEKPEEQEPEDFVKNIVINTLRLFYVEYKKKKLEEASLAGHVEEANALTFEGE